MLGSAGEKKSRSDRRKERKDKKEASKAVGRAALLGDEEERKQVGVG